MMTRKDYQMVADAMRHTRPDCRQRLSVWLDIVGCLCDSLRANPRFDARRFLEACGYFDDEGNIMS